jgi:phage-related protein
MARMPLKRLQVVFFRTAAGNEPVREWLKSLSPPDRRVIGFDLQRVEFRWPIGMPLTRALGDGLHEVRSTLASRRIARVLFYVSEDGELVVLHGFIKKSQRIPVDDLAIARRNKRTHEDAA